MASSDPLPQPQPIAQAVEEELSFLALLRALHSKVDQLNDLKTDVAELRKELLANSRQISGLQQRMVSQAQLLASVNENFARVVSVATVQGLTIDRVEKKLDRLLEVFTVIVPDPTPPGGKPP